MAPSTPNFWKERCLRAYALLPLSWIYRVLSKIRNHIITPANTSLRVICVGNIAVGGAGKTPIALAIGKLLKELDIPYHFLSKGYGGMITSPTPVDTKKHTANDVGDEPLLLAKQAPTIISKNWKVGAETIDHYSDVVIMDDGLQNPGINKDLSLLVINGQYGLGNGFLFPAGPLREPLQKALKRIDAVIIIGEDIHQLSDHIHAPIINAIVESKFPKKLQTKRIIAFAGIAHPNKFFGSIKEHPCELVETYSFPDHHPYTEEEIDQLILKAKRANAILLTTEKDFVRISKKYQKHIETLPIAIKWSYKKEVINLLKSKITTAS